MPNNNKARGYKLEAEIRDAFECRGMECERAWGSDGRALGEAKDVDLRVDIAGTPWTIQSKRKKNIAKYIKPSSYSADMVITREDYGKPLVVMQLDDLITIIKDLEEK